MRLAALVLVGMVASASAQPAPVPPQRWRLTLVEGQTIDVDVVASDAVNFVVRTPQGATYTISRARIVGAVRLDLPLPAPPPPLPAPPVAKQSKDDLWQPKDYIKGGLKVLAGAYGVTAVAAAVRLSADPDAAYGFIPLIGASVWAGRDEDEFGRDGWDYLSLLPTLVQLGGAYVAVNAAVDPDKYGGKKSKSVTVIPIKARGVVGLGLGGTF